MSDDRDNIINLQAVREERAAAKEAELEPVGRFDRAAKNQCDHRRVYVSDNSVRVWCQDCEEPLSALDVLREYAHQERRLKHATTHATTERKRVEDAVEQLKREEKRLKARVKRAREELAKCERQIELLPADIARAAFQAIASELDE